MKLNFRQPSEVFFREIYSARVTECRYVAESSLMPINPWERCSLINRVLVQEWMYWLFRSVLNYFFRNLNIGTDRSNSFIVESLLNIKFLGFFSATEQQDKTQERLSKRFDTFILRAKKMGLEPRTLDPRFYGQFFFFTANSYNFAIFTSNGQVRASIIMLVTWESRCLIRLYGIVSPGCLFSSRRSVEDFSACMKGQQWQKTSRWVKF